MRISVPARLGLGLLTTACVLAGTAIAAVAATNGTVAGTLWTHDGKPAAGVSVALQDLNENVLQTGVTKADGTYQVTGVRAGSVKVQFVPGFSQWATGMADFDHGTKFSVTAGRTTTVNDHLLASGTITGHLVDAAGNPLSAGVRITSVTTDDDQFLSAGDDGRYSTSVLPGTYNVSFSTDGPSQWAHQKRTRATAEKFSVAAGQTVTVDDTQLPTGSLTGSYRNAVGNGVSDVQVDLYANGEQVADTVTDPDGAFSWSAVLAGDYTMSFTLDGGRVEWANGKVGKAAADPISVTAGHETVVDERPPGLGVVAGHYTTPGGKPVAQTVVALTDDDGNDAYSGKTDSSGAFRLADVRAGSYKVRFATNGLVQWVPQTFSSDQAKPVTVASGNTTTVDETQVPPATIRVTARDSQNGRVVPTFCVELGGPQDGNACTKSGTVTVANLQPGKYSVFVQPAASTFHQYAEVSVTASSGTVTDQTVRTAAGGIITATVTDRSTGKPVANAEVLSTAAGSDIVPDGGLATDANGHLEKFVIAPGAYNLFVSPPGRYGAQWVGANGGTGTAKGAAKIVVQAGKVTQAPVVRLDQAGSISGTVTTAATGKPAKDAWVSVDPWSYHVGPEVAASTDTAGHYTLGGLGPYAWPLLFTNFATARQWSGGTANRLAATTVKVTAGATATYNYALASGVTISGKLTTSSTFEVAFIDVYNATTGDLMGEVEIDQGRQSYSLPVFGNQTVVLVCDVHPGDGKADRLVWYGGKDRAHAKPLKLAKSGTLTANFTVD